MLEIKKDLSTRAHLNDQARRLARPWTIKNGVLIVSSSQMCFCSPNVDHNGLGARDETVGHSQADVCRDVVCQLRRNAGWCAG